jgi:hypothetical protein
MRGYFEAKTRKAFKKDSKKSVFEMTANQSISFTS